MASSAGLCLRELEIFVHFLVLRSFSLKAARKENKDKRVEKRLLVLELRAAGTQRNLGTL